MHDIVRSRYLVCTFDCLEALERAVGCGAVDQRDGCQKSGSNNACHRTLYTNCGTPCVAQLPQAQSSFRAHDSRPNVAFTRDISLATWFVCERVDIFLNRTGTRLAAVPQSMQQQKSYRSLLQRSLAARAVTAHCLQQPA